MTAAILNRPQTKTENKMKSAPLRAVSNTASLSTAAVEPASSLNAVQLELVLETIAGKTHTLQKLLALLQTNQIKDGFAQSVCIDAAADLVTAIGTMADEAVGGGVIGDANRWFYGPNFNNTGVMADA